jgi:sulfide:quinone oxidoreductase
VPVDRATLKTKLDGVFAIGDCTTIGMPGRWKPDVPLTLPKVGVFAHGQAIVVACRLAAEIAATECKDVFCGDGSCMLAAGGGVAGLASGNFFAEPMPEIHFRKTGRVSNSGG